MSPSPRDDSDDTPTPPDRSTVVLLLGIAGDTTWRMFAPILIFGALGVWGDLTFHTKPWLTIGAIVIAVICTAHLIKRQLQKGTTK